MIVTIWLYFVLFFIGISVGSFINAFEYRLYKKMDFLKQRSICPSCKHTLGVMDLIPLLSFALIHGKCRYCGTKVSWQYPVVEFLGGVLFLASGCYVSSRMHILGVSDMLLMLLVSTLLGCIFSLFLFFALYDVKHQIVPDKVVLPSIFFVTILDLILALGIHFDLFPSLLSLFEGFHLLWNVLSGVFGGVFIGFIIFLTHGEGMGGGDLKLVVLMGMLLGGQKLIVAMYFAVIFGSLVGIFWGAKKGKIIGFKIPFALFLSLGTIVAFLWGNAIWDYFFKMV